MRVEAVWTTRTELRAMRIAAAGGGIVKVLPGRSSSRPAAAGRPKRLKAEAQRRQRMVVRCSACDSSRKHNSPRRLRRTRHRRRPGQQAVTQRHKQKQTENTH